MKEMRKQNAPKPESTAIRKGDIMTDEVGAGPEAGVNAFSDATPLSEGRAMAPPLSQSGGTSRPPFRTRLFAMLLLFALVPTLIVTLAWTGLAYRMLSVQSASSAWENVARSGDDVFRSLDSTTLGAEAKQAIATHESQLRQSAQLARQFDYVTERSMRIVFAAAVFVVIVVAVGASRVAGHLSRQLSRPLDELVGWTRLIRSGQPLPEKAGRRGAPEFEVLRSGMRTMALDLRAGRQRAIDAERAEAFRESARRFAHELKNPLTPIRFAVDRIRRHAPEELHETVEVLAEETTRLETMARSFAQFGRLPDGPPAPVDIVELVTRTARATVPDCLTLELNCDSELPLVVGYYEPLVRAVTNVLINAVEATASPGTVKIGVFQEGPAVAISIADSGAGISAEKLASIFDPYVTTKPGGTGLGLAITRQTIEAHHGTITATSVKGSGTVVTIHLPMKSAIGTDAGGEIKSDTDALSVSFLEGEKA